MKIDLGLQLYSLRNIVNGDAPGLLAKVKKAGYDSVEFAGFYEMDTHTLRNTLDRLGLKCHSTHMGIDEHTDLDELIALHKTLGAKYITIPWANWDTAEKLQSQIRLYNEAGRKIHDAGLFLLYHNHHHEFDTKYDGKCVLDLMRDGTDPEALGFELDIFWATYAGEKPAEVIERFGSRMQALHLKDMNNLQDKKMTECGTGVVDIRGSLVAAKEFGINTFMVEQDEIDMEPIESVATSAANVRKIAETI